MEKTHKTEQNTGNECKLIWWPSHEFRKIFCAAVYNIVECAKIIHLILFPLVWPSTSFFSPSLVSRMDSRQAGFMKRPTSCLIPEKIRNPTKESTIRKKTQTNKQKINGELIHFDCSVVCCAVSDPFHFFTMEFHMEEKPSQSNLKELISISWSSLGVSVASSVSIYCCHIEITSTRAVGSLQQSFMSGTKL